MKFNRLTVIIVLGLVAIIGILVAQLLWTRQAFDIEEKKFGQRVHIALLEVAKKLYEGTSHELPSENPVQKVSSDYYIVNVNNDFEPEILEYYLKTEFQKINLHTDFEYAMYNCESDEMVYGNFVAADDNSQKASSVYFPKHKNLVYYFAIRFPNETSFLFSSLKFWFVLSFALIIILVVYVYSIIVILQQKKYSELQRDFINNMTHEFKTPLSSILIASNYLIGQDKIAGDPKLGKYTNIIISQSKKLNSHIEKILNIAKSDTNPLALDLKEISINAVIAEVVENIRLKYDQIKVTVTSDEEFIISADAFHFTNLVYNLIDNSVKYCDGIAKIDISISKTGGVVHLKFADNGIGIPAKHINYIFDKFYRVAGSKSNEVNGFGLGLYYVMKVCKLHKWKIRAENNPDKGITMSIQIPAR